MKRTRDWRQYFTPEERHPLSIHDALIAQAEMELRTQSKARQLIQNRATKRGAWKEKQA